MMKSFESLESYLQTQCAERQLRSDVAICLGAIATACSKIAKLIARGPLAGDLSQVHGDNSDGDAQKELDIVANDCVIECLADAPVAWLLSEELENPLAMQKGAELLIAIDPLDGSSNIETNAAVGTIFSIAPAIDAEATAPDPVVLQPGIHQFAAAYCIYGPQTSLILTVGAGTHIFTLDPDGGEFRLTQSNIQIPQTTQEFAINASNFRHWDASIRTYVDDCLAGEDGLRQGNYNMRWVASLVAECYRILIRGGIFLYPGDSRKGYAQGRLRLLYECNPIAMLIEQAGGSATTGSQRILEVIPRKVHQRVPMIFGSAGEIRRVKRYIEGSDLGAERSQLFGRRGLFRV